MPSRFTRRRFGRGVLAVGAFAAAGCLGDGTASADDSGGSGEDGGSDDETTEIREELKVGGHVLSSEFPLHLYDAENDGYQGRGAAYVQAHTDYSHWHKELELPVGGHQTFRIELVNHEREQIPVGSDGEFRIDASLTPDSPDDLVEIAVQDALLNLVAGSSPGEGELVIDLLDGDEVVWTTPGLPIAVVEDG